MEKDKKIACFSCKKSFTISELEIKIQTTDIFEGIDWGIPHWKEYECKCCPNCTFPILRDNKIIKWKRAGKNR